MLIGFFCSVLGLALGFYGSEKIFSEETLPVPAGASERLQQVIGQAGLPSVATRKVLVPGSEDQWRTAARLHADNQPESIAQLSARLAVDHQPDLMDGVAVHWLQPGTADPDRRLFVYLHDGAYVFGAGEAGISEAVVIAARTGLLTVAIDYRMPPDHPHPTALEDVEAVYRGLLRSRKASQLAMGGTSAGGGLTLAAMHHLKGLGLPLPGALFLGTPWADLSKTGDTLHTLEGVDRILVTYEGLLAEASLLYAGGVDLQDPLLSPVYGEFAGFPPAYLVTGTRDLFLSDTARVHRKFRAAGIEADLNVYEGLSHAEYKFIEGSREHDAIYGELKAFLSRHLH